MQAERACFMNKQNAEREWKREEGERERESAGMCERDRERAHVKDAQLSVSRTVGKVMKSAKLSRANKCEKLYEYPYSYSFHALTHSHFNNKHV